MRLVFVVAEDNTGKQGRVWVLVECILQLVIRIGGRISHFLRVGFRIFYSKAMSANLRCRERRGKFKALPKTKTLTWIGKAILFTVS
jgi:hypothetical protein